MGERGAMSKKPFLKVCLVSLCLMALDIVAVGQTQEIPGRIDVMKEELLRNFTALQKEQVPPYYISYSIDEVRTQYVAGAFGAIISKNEDTTASLRISLRTGSYSLDNSHELRGDSLSSLRRSLSTSIRAPLSASPEALAVILWRETDKAYRNAVETLSRVKSEQKVKIAEEDKSDDFSKAKPHVSLEKPRDIQVDLEKWRIRIRKFTEQFKDYPFINDSIGVFQSEVRPVLRPLLAE
jgi:TldD protein